MKKVFEIWFASMILATMISSLSASAAPNTNLLNNPSLEKTVDVGTKKYFERWDTWQSLDNLTQPFKYEISSDAHAGSKSLKIFQLTGQSQTQAAYQMFNKDSGINLNANFTFTAWVKYANISGDGFNVGIQKKNDSLNIACNIFSKNITGTSSGWEKVTITSIDAPFNVSAVVPIINVHPGNANGYVIIDDMSFTGSTTYVPGNFIKEAGYEGSKPDGKMLNEGADIQTWPGYNKSTQKISMVNTVKHSGKQSCKIAQSTEVQAIYYIFDKQRCPKLFEMDKWEFGAWIKMESVTVPLEGDGVMLLADAQYTTGNTKSFNISPMTGSSDWKHYTISFNKEDFAPNTLNQFVVKVQVPIGTGAIYIDDVYFGKPGSNGVPQKISLVDVLKPGSAASSSSSGTVSSESQTSEPIGTQSQKNSDASAVTSSEVTESIVESTSLVESSTTATSKTASTTGGEVDGSVKTGLIAAIIAAVIVVLTGVAFVLYKAGILKRIFNSKKG